MPTKNYTKLEGELKNSNTINQASGDKPEQEKTYKKREAFFISRKDQNFVKLTHASYMIAGVGITVGFSLLLASTVFPPLLIPSIITIAVSGNVGIFGILGAYAKYIVDHKREERAFNEAKKIEPGIKVVTKKQLEKIKSREKAQVKIDKSKASPQPVQKSLTERRNEKNNNLQQNPRTTDLTKSNLNLLNKGVEKNISGRTL